MGAKSMIQWENLTRRSDLVLMRSSKKAVHATFEIYLESDHFSSPSTTSVPPSTISHLYVSCRLPAPPLVSLLHRSQRESSKKRVKSCYLSAVFPLSTYGRWGEGSRVLTMAYKALHGLRPLPYSLEHFISLTLSSLHGTGLQIQIVCLHWTDS